jgi:YVTN family beta-propeller protein/YD repeat-containing protein
VYIGNTGSNSVSVISTATDAVIATVSLGGDPLGITVLPNGTAVYVSISSGSTGSVSVISTSSNSVTATITLPTQGAPSGPIPSVIAAAPNSSTVYVLCSGSNLFENSIPTQFVTIPTNSNTATGIVLSGYINWHGLAISPDGSKAYASSISSFFILNTSDGSTLSTVTLPNGESGWGVAVSPDGSSVYVAANNGSSGSLNKITGASITATASISTQTYNYTNAGLPFALTSVTDENGNTYATWTYDTYGRGLTSALGGSALNADLTTITYNDANLTRTVTNPLGVTDTYTLTTLQNVPKVTQISRAATSTTVAATESMGYDTNGYLNSLTDWNGNQTTYVNDAHGDPTTINEAVGSSVARTTTIVYDLTFVHLPDTITTTGLTTGFTYQPTTGNVLTQTLTDTTTQSVPYSTNGQTRTWNYGWNNFLLASVKTPNGNLTQFGYDGTGALTSVTNALTQVTNITQHTGGGYPQTIVDPNGATNGITTILAYDARQRLTSKTLSTSAGTEVTTYTLDPTGDLTKLTLADNSYISYQYDNAHRVTQATNALGEYQMYTLDALGDAKQVNTYDGSNTEWRQQTRTFDALGRELSYVGGGTLDKTSYTYDPNGNMLTITDGDNHATTRVFDALNRLSASTDANKGLTQFAYDAHDRVTKLHDRVTKLTDANNHATSNVYDGFGDGIQVASPDTGTAVYYFDQDANLTKKVDGANVTVNLTYDALERIASKTFPADSTQNVYFAYDQPYSWPYSNNEIGRLSYVNDAAGVMYFAYDTYGNVSHRERTTHSYVDVNDIWMSYDPVNRVSAIKYPSGLYTAFNRDAAGQLDNINITPPGSQTQQTVDWVNYAPFYGPLRYESAGNNMRVNKYPDQDYRTYLLQIQSNGGSTNLLNGTLIYDAASNLKVFSDTVNSFNNQTLGYDVINRLTSATSGSGGYGSLSWKYDKVGNLTSQTVNSSTTTYGYASGTNRLASIKNGTTINVTTNGNGNITSIPPADNSARPPHTLTTSLTGCHPSRDLQKASRRFSMTVSGSATASRIPAATQTPTPTTSLATSSRKTITAPSPTISTTTAYPLGCGCRAQVLCILFTPASRERR